MKNTNVKLQCETLEQREVPAITTNLMNGTLNIVGDKTSDIALVDLVGNKVTITDKQTNKTFRFDVAKVNRLRFDGGAMHDYFANNTSIGGVYKGGAGRDILIGGTGSDYFDGGEGNDIIDSFNDNVSQNTLVGGGGNDNLTGGQLNDTVLAGNGNDQVYDILGTNYVDGGLGKDRLLVNGNGITISTKDDVVATFFKNRGNEIVQENDIIYFLPNSFSSNTKDNVLTIDDDGKNYLVTYNGVVSSFKKSSVKLFAGFGGAGVDLFLNNTSLDCVFYGGVGGANDVLQGGKGNDLLKGGGGNDTIFGGGGNDDIAGNGGVDFLDGENGSNIIRVDSLDSFFSNEKDILVGNIVR